MTERIDTSDMRALAIVEENSHVLYRMVCEATQEIDRLRAMLTDVMGELCHEEGCRCCGGLYGDDND
jgi:hypothetical protein